METASYFQPAVAFLTAAAICAAVISGPDGIFSGTFRPAQQTFTFVPPTSMTRTFIAVCSNLPRPPPAGRPAAGPSVPGSYSYIGLGPWITGSTMAQAASTTSWRAKSVASPAMASPSSRSYASMRPSLPCSAASTTESSTGSPVIPSPGRLARAPMRDGDLRAQPEAHVVAHRRRRLVEDHLRGGFELDR